MASAGSVTIDFAAETAKFTAELKKVRGELKTLQSQVGGISGQLGKAGVAVKAFVSGFAVVATIKGTLSAVVRATAESEAAVAQLDSALKNAGRSVAAESSRFQKFATSLQGVTTFTDEAVIGVETLLLGFKGLSGDTIFRASSAILDVSTRLGTDLKSASVAVGKALQDPVNGMTALGKMGIVVADSQKDFIKTLVASGRTTEAQGILLKELEKRFGGAAVAARNTLGGALEGLKNNFGDLFEVTGKGSGAATNAINSLSDAVASPKLKEAIHALTDQLGNIINLFVLIGTKSAEGIGQLIESTETAADRIDQKFSQRFGKTWDLAKKVGSFVGAAGNAILNPVTSGLSLLADSLEKKSLASPGHGAIRGPAGSLVEEREFDFAEEQKKIELRQKIIDNSLQTSFAVLDELVEKQKPLDEAREESLKIFAQRELDILSDQIERRLEIERQYTDQLGVEQRRRADVEARTAQETVEVRQDTAFKSLAILAFFIQGNKNASKALELANKFQSLRQVAIDTKAAAVKALKIYGPTPAGYGAAAAAIAFGALQAKGILAADTSFNVGGSAPVSSGSSVATVGPEQSIAAEPQAAITVHVNGYISKDVVDDLVDGLSDRFRRGVVVIQGGSNQANAIRQGS